MLLVAQFFHRDRNDIADNTETFIEKSKETKLKKYSDENYNNRGKARQTCLENYGVDHNFKIDECIYKREIGRAHV